MAFAGDSVVVSLIIWKKVGHFSIMVDAMVICPSAIYIQSDKLSVAGFVAKVDFVALAWVALI